MSQQSALIIASSYWVSNLRNTSAIGIVNTIQVTQLAKTTHHALIELKIKNTAYKERIERAKPTRSLTQQFPHGSVKQSINPKILHSMWILGYTEGATKAEEVSNEVVWSWPHNRMKDSGKEVVDWVDQIIAMGNFNLFECDPKGSAQLLVISVVTELDTMNASSVVKEPEQCKDRIVKLMKKAPSHLCASFCSRQNLCRAKPNEVT